MTSEQSIKEQKGRGCTGPTLVCLSCHLLSWAPLLENNIKILANKNNNKARREAEKKHRLEKDKQKEVRLKVLGNTFPREKKNTEHLRRDGVDLKCKKQIRKSFLTKLS